MPATARPVSSHGTIFLTGSASDLTFGSFGS